jgi:hypothetical protein
MDERNRTPVDPAVYEERPGVFSNAMLGGAAGFITGILVAIAAMLHTGIAGPEEAWLPMKLVAGTWGGVDVLVGGGATIAVGLATHLGVATGWGVLFGLLTARLRHWMLTIIAGFLYSGVVWIVMTWGFVPWLNPTMAARINVQPYWWWWVLHIIYGGILGIIFAAMRGMWQRPKSPAPAQSA